MSWIKRRGQTTPNPAAAPPVQMYNPNQHTTGHENQWQQQAHNNWYTHNAYQTKPEPDSQAQMNYWQQQQQQQQHPYNSTSHHQETQPPNTQQYGQYQDQTAAYYQNNSGYQQQTYGNMQYNQQYNENNVYAAQQPQQQTQPNAEGDDWQWGGWGDEDNSNIQTPQQAATTTKSQVQNSIGETFTNDDTWNWSLEDNSASSQTSNKVDNKPDITEDLFPKVKVSEKISPKSEPSPELPKPVHNFDTLSVNKRGKLETPQWSVESQMSQESSDDILHTSESDKSHMMSRSSTISHSPISTQEPLNVNPEVDPKWYGAEASKQFENKEIVKKEIVDNELVLNNSTPPPPKNSQTPPILAPQGSSDDLKNPYKRTTGLSHKPVNKFSSKPPVDSRQNVYAPSFHNQTVNLETLPDNSEQPDSVPTSSSGLPPPARKISATKPVQQWPENNEAPVNDRNQYLETNQLSDVNLHEFGGSNVQQENTDSAPPPGLRRMVLGQMEQNESVNSTNVADVPASNTRTQYPTVVPPAGLHRMVPGESSSPVSTQQHQQENSEPEFNQPLSEIAQSRSATIGADTPPAVPINPQSTNRSETIGGGDNQPISQLQLPSQSIHKRGTSVSSNESGVLSGHRSDSLQPSNSDLNVEEKNSVEGAKTNDVNNITNAVRNLTVGENVTDTHTSNNSLNDSRGRRYSRQESTDDSEQERKKLPRNSRDKRYHEKSKRDKDRDREREHKDKSGRDRELDRERDRYTPESYRDKKYDRRRHRDRRYEEDTDYYSDKDRRARDDRDRDYDKKYSSLRKDKDKERRKRDPREYERDARRRGDYYYSRHEDDYEDETKSRPTSRSDSMHDSIRERGHDRDPRDRRHRERDRYNRRPRDQRDMYNPYQGYAYDTYNPYFQQYQYYENLRRTNPQAYADWYRKYYQQATGQASYGGDDRGSVHSGRSSANEELAKDSFSRPFDNTDSSMNFEDSSIAAQRLTPAKFATAHIKASISSGKFLRILPNYPLDGQPATVEFCNLQSLVLNDEEYKELNIFPGPLIKGVTHKKTIIEYCESKIHGAAYNSNIVDLDSYILMWELLILLIRQNGMVVGTDIAELLLKNKNREPVARPASVISSISSNAADANVASENNAQHNSEISNGSSNSVMKEEEVTNKFREYLLYGSTQEALEWAMKHGLWGHALFLASKLDKRTYANVMMRFANGLPINDPLQTLYQLLSARMPAAVTCVSEEKWGDWRPHLAMILSNSTQRPELNCKAITTLGDTLMNRGSLYAAQFCYLMAEVGFGKHDNPETKLVLLGADHSKPFPKFVTNEAIHMTEIYEYACSLNDSDFIIPDFQIYKYMVATRLADGGLLEKSLSYLERLATYIVRNPSAVQPNLVDNVYSLADRLKYYDPVGDAEDESQFGGGIETSRPDNSWLKELRAIQSDYQSGLITHESIQNLAMYEPPAVEADVTLSQTYDATNQDAWQQQYNQQYQQNLSQQQTQWQPEQQLNQSEYEQQVTQQQQQNDYPSTQYQDQQQYWQNQQQQQWNMDQSANQYTSETSDLQQSYASNAQNEDVPQISMPNQSKGKSPYDEEPLQHETKKESPAKAKPENKPAQEKTSTRWFGGIFSKLVPKPTNQMKLPDDKNPKIVWDQDKKRWVNINEDSNDVATELKPPPKLADMMPKMPQGPGTAPLPNPNMIPNDVPMMMPNVAVPSDVGQIPDQVTGMVPNSMSAGSAQPSEGISNPLMKPSQQNMFKLQGGRNLKKAYVDVFNPSGKPSGPTSLPNPEAFNSAPAPQMNFFIPQPINDPNAPTDFLTPAPPMQYDENAQRKKH